MFSSTPPSQEHIQSSITSASSLKSQGNQFFLAQKYKKAIQKYKYMALYLNGLEGNVQSAMMANNVPSHGNGEQKNALTMEQIVQEHGKDSWQAEVAALTLSSANNLSICFLKIGKPQKTVQYANQVLAFEPNNVKAKMRRFQGYLGTASLDKAKSDLGDLQQALQEGNATGLDEKMLDSLEKQYHKALKQQDAKEKKVYNRMFAGLSK